MNETKHTTLLPEQARIRDAAQELLDALAAVPLPASWPSPAWTPMHYAVDQARLTVARLHDEAASIVTSDTLAARQAEIAAVREYQAGHRTNVGGTHGWYDGCPDAQVRP